MARDIDSDDQAGRGQKPAPRRYGSVVIILHWCMALGFFAMLGSGFVMSYVDIDQSLKFNLYQWHKAGGVLLLLAFVLRFCLRVFSRAPELPVHFPKFDAVAAKFGHYGLYGLMFLVPLSGWLMVSSSVYGLPTSVFGWFNWPHIPGIEGDEGIHDTSDLAHFVLTKVFAVMIIVHIGAVVKHKVKDNENLLRRMWWVKQSDMKE